MLVDLRVKNFALIDELEISFKRGLNVLTGETGAGKSIIIGALEMMLGARASTDIIRSGQETAYIEAVYEPEQLDEINQILQEAGIEPDPSILLLSREINRNGRNRSRINGQPATVSMIKQISGFLVDIHGQHEHQSLLDPTLHLELIDEFIGNTIVPLKKEIEATYRKIKEIDKRLAGIVIDDSEKARRMDLLNFQVQEIEEANLQAGELEDLTSQYKMLTNMETIFSITGKVQGQISTDDFQGSSILDLLGQLMKEMESIADFQPQLGVFYERLKDLFFQMQDLGYDITDYHEQLEFNQEKLDKIEKRLNLINNLQRKYGETIEEILSYKEKAADQLKQLIEQEKLLEELKQEKKLLHDDYYQLAVQLSSIRKEKAQELEIQILSELKDLAMKDAVIKANFTERAPQANGIDQVEFIISTNPGENLKPLVKIASGGELSRIMLAFKTIISEIDRVDTLIFDEVDSGVGGKTAQMMAEKLAIISKQRQIITITHLPQIASMSDHHFFISKHTEQGHTYTTIYPLDGEGKKEELARMLGGVELTQTTLQHAEEMIKMAEHKKAVLTV